MTEDEAAEMYQGVHGPQGHLTRAGSRRTACQGESGTGEIPKNGVHFCLFDTN